MSIVVAYLDQNLVYDTNCPLSLATYLCLQNLSVVCVFLLIYSTTMFVQGGVNFESVEVFKIWMRPMNGLC